MGIDLGPLSSLETTPPGGQSLLRCGCAVNGTLKEGHLVRMWCCSVSGTMHNWSLSTFLLEEDG